MGGSFKLPHTSTAHSVVLKTFCEYRRTGPSVCIVYLLTYLCGFFQLRCYHYGKPFDERSDTADSALDPNLHYG